jgi:hypothetical protein
LTYHRFELKVFNTKILQNRNRRKRFSATVVLYLAFKAVEYWVAVECGSDSSSICCKGRVLLSEAGT